MATVKLRNSINKGKVPLTFATLLATMTPALAQDVAVPAAGPVKQEKRLSRALEEVVVTAQKREQSQQDVPIAIQAFGGGKLEAFGIEDTTQMGRIIPSLQFTGVVGYTLVYLRGVGTDAFAPSSDPSVATYIDGVYMPAGHGVFQSFGGVERVEVLKGPQGTLFGRNSTGGAISVITKEPNPDEIEAELSYEIQNYDSKRAKAYVSVPVTDWFSASFSGISYEAEEYYTQVGRDLPPITTDAGRIKINIHPTDNLELSLAYFKSRQTIISSALSENNDPSTLGTLLLIPESEDDYTTAMDFPARFLSHQDVKYGTLTWRLPAFDVKVIASDVLALTNFASTDFDGSPIPIAAFDSTNQYSDYQTAEIQFLSNDQSWASEDLEWIAGLYYLESEVGYDPAHLRVGPDLVGGILDNTLGLPPALTGLVGGILDALPLGSTPLGDDGLNLEFRGLLGTKSTSAFVQATWHTTDWLDLTVGGRYQTEERFLIKSQTGVLAPDGNSTIDVFEFPLESSDASNFSPKVVVSTYPMEDVMVYASWSKGYKSATYNVVNVYEAPDFVEPEEVTQYELGVKSEWMDGNFRINGAIFETTIDNLQSGFVSLLAGGAVTLENAGQAQIRGAEFDMTLVPFPEWNPGLVVTANGGYLDAIYTDYRDGAGYDEDTGLFSNNLDFTGNNIVRAPELTAGVNVIQTFAIGLDNELEVSVDAYYNSGFAYTPQNTIEEPSYMIVNGRLSYYYIPWRIRLTAFGQNLDNERYHYARFQTDFGVNQTLAAPRQYGLRLQWDY